MSRTRSRSPKAAADRRRFPIRIRVKVPSRGFGPKLDHLNAWLKDMAGQDGYAIHSDTQPGLHAVAIFLDEPALVRVMIETFELELAPYEP